MNITLTEFEAGCIELYLFWGNSSSLQAKNRIFNKINQARRDAATVPDEPAKPECSTWPNG